MWDGRNDSIVHVKRPTERDPVVYDACLAFRTWESKTDLDVALMERYRFTLGEMRQDAKKNL